MLHFLLNSKAHFEGGGLYFLCVTHGLLAPHLQLQLLKQPHYSHNCFRVSAVIPLFQPRWLRDRWIAAVQTGQVASVYSEAFTLLSD